MVHILQLPRAARVCAIVRSTQECVNCVAWMPEFQTSTSGCKVETGALWLLQPNVDMWVLSCHSSHHSRGSAGLPGFHLPMRHILSRCHVSVAACEHGVYVSVT